MNWEFDKKTCMMKPKDNRPEDNIELMTKMPNKTGWIKFFQNRVNIHSVGNTRYAKVVWFDKSTGMVSENQNGTDAVNFRDYILPGAGKPAGWMYVNK